MTPFFLLAAALAFLPGRAWAATYSIHDEGGFAPSGRRVEFADHYGWRSYAVDFDFGLDLAARELTKDSKLAIKILKRDGKTWSCVCRAKGRYAMSANINFIYEKGISIVADCRIPEKEFAKAVNLDKHDVGFPSFVFQAIIQEGAARAGDQRGFYFAPGGQIESSEINAYAAGNSDPTNLAVVLRSN